MSNVNLISLLDGLTLGEKQEVGVMTVIPLLDPNEGESLVADFSEVDFKGTTNYGSFYFGVNSEKPFVLPAGYSVMTKQSAQDHGTPLTHILAPKENKVPYACCIEQSQPGMIEGNKDLDFNLMPLSIRKNHFAKYIKNVPADKPFDGNITDFSRLWPVISAFQRELVGKKEAHMIYFFTKFVDQLNQFNAEFEAVKTQRGAIILFNNEVVGIEVAPSSAYWKVVWNKLIRDCYGSEIVYRTFKKLIPSYKDKVSRTVDFEGVTSIADIRAAMAASSKDYNEKILESITETLMKKPRQYKANINNSPFFDYSIAGLGDNNYAEVVTTKEGKVVYASVLL